MMYVTATVSALLVFIFIKLSFQVIELRKMHKVAFGDGGIDALERAIRAHANFAEYVPMGLILMGALELNGAPWMLVAFVGGFLVLGRYFHAKGLYRDGADFEDRVTGMKFTLVGLALSAFANMAWVAYSLIASARFAASLAMS
jgi:uncharacterized membrane protein YecN with MAPEG domain